VKAALPDLLADLLNDARPCHAGQRRTSRREPAAQGQRTDPDGKSYWSRSSPTWVEGGRVGCGLIPRVGA